jgi:hypothetical protein
MSRLAVLLLTALLSATGAGAQSRDDLATAARAFDESALRNGDDNAKPMPVRKWTGPIRLGFANASAAPNLVELTRAAVKSNAAEAGVDIVDLPDRDTSANHVVFFDENGLRGVSGDCVSQFWTKQFAIVRAELRINPTRTRDVDRCAVHESMHAFGFISHPHGAVSVLSYVYKAQRTLTPLDKHLFHTLYDPRMTIGLKPAPASQLACRILGERLGSNADDVAAVCTDRKGPVPPF